MGAPQLTTIPDILSHQKHKSNLDNILRVNFTDLRFDMSYLSVRHKSCAYNTETSIRSFVTKLPISHRLNTFDNYNVSRASYLL
jgi:hypothetical protein